MFHLLVTLSVCNAHKPCKLAERIEVLFGVGTPRGLMNNVLDWWARFFSNGFDADAAKLGYFDHLFYLRFQLLHNHNRLILES